MIYNKSKEKLYSVQTDNDEGKKTRSIDLLTFFWPNFVLSDNIIIRQWPANRFKKYFGEVVSDKESMDILAGYDVDGFIQFYQSVKETDNPIIQIITLK
jgi:hypothetical protein